MSQDARDSNKFTVSTFVGAGQTVVFKLVYEELLERKGGNYQLVVKPALQTKITFSSNNTMIRRNTVIPYTMQSLVIGYQSKCILRPANSPQTDITPKILKTAL